MKPHRAYTLTYLLIALPMALLIGTMGMQIIHRALRAQRVGAEQAANCANLQRLLEVTRDDARVARAVALAASDDATRLDLALTAPGASVRYVVRTVDRAVVVTRAVPPQRTTHTFRFVNARIAPRIERVAGQDRLIWWQLDSDMELRHGLPQTTRLAGAVKMGVLP